MKIIRIKVKPKARTSELEAQSDGTWLARVKASPVEGRANEELIALVARHFGIPKARVSIKSGTKARMKMVTIDERG